MQTSWLTPETTKSDWLLEIWWKLSIWATICAKNIFFPNFSLFVDFLWPVCFTRFYFERKRLKTMPTSWLTPETTKSDWLLEIWSRLSILSTICAKNIFFWKFSNFASFLRSVCLTKVEFSSLSNILGNSTLEPFWLVNLAFVCTDDAGKHVKAAKTHFHRHLVQLETSKDQISLKFWYTEPWHVIPPPKFPKTRHNNGSESQLWDWLRTSEFHKKWCFCVPNIILKTKKNRRWWINIWFFLYHCDSKLFWGSWCNHES